MRFMKNYGKIAQHAPAYSVNDEFSRVLHQQMEFFSSSPSADTINRVRGEVNEASFFKALAFCMSFLFLCPYGFSTWVFMVAHFDATCGKGLLLERLLLIDQNETIL